MANLEIPAIETRGAGRLRFDTEGRLLVMAIEGTYAVAFPGGSSYSTTSTTWTTVAGSSGVDELMRQILNPKVPAADRRSFQERLAGIAKEHINLSTLGQIARIAKDIADVLKDK